MNTLILASQSPRRKELLSQLGYTFSCHPADIDETEKPNETPCQYVERLALEKAQHIANQAVNTSTVIGSDTCVVCADKILGKPNDLTQCIEHLSLLSNTTHQVLTSVAVVQGQLSKTIVVLTHVTFKALTLNEMKNYWQTGEPQDKAGSYGIQGIGGQFVKQMNGSYSAVVGLPLYETAQLLAEFSFPSSIQSI